MALFTFVAVQMMEFAGGAYPEIETKSLLNTVPSRNSTESSLGASRAFTAALILTLALGIGSFSLMTVVMFRPCRTDVGRLLYITTPNEDYPATSPSISA